MNHEVVYKLYPNVVTINNEIPYDINGNVVEIDLDAVDTETNKISYIEEREFAYPSIRKQLDMLYHDIKNNRLVSGDWIAAIEEVKQQYPKPE